jgi:hypothetical protein
MIDVSLFNRVRNKAADKGISVYLGQYKMQKPYDSDVFVITITETKVVEGEDALTLFLNQFEQILNPPANTQPVKEVDTVNATDQTSVEVTEPVNTEPSN